MSSFLCLCYRVCGYPFVVIFFLFSYFHLKLWAHAGNSSHVAVHPAWLGLVEAETCLYRYAGHLMSATPFLTKCHFGVRSEMDLGHVVGHKLLIVTHSSKPGLFLPLPASYKKIVWNWACLIQMGKTYIYMGSVHVFLVFVLLLLPHLSLFHHLAPWGTVSFPTSSRGGRGKQVLSSKRSFLT